MITPQIKAAITRFDKACREMAFKGAQPLENHEQIDEEHKKSRINLEYQIQKVFDHIKKNTP